ncbi:MAG: thioredoxin family protein [Pyrinomonadaceae bacterium]|nr:thioredoxin family protein [Pyrinomonadaceae bacterium]
MNYQNQPSKTGLENPESNSKKLRVSLYLSAVLILLFSFTAFAQNPTKWTLESDSKGKSLKKDESFKADLKAEVEDGWHLYAVEQPTGGPFPTKITIPENTPFAIAGNVESSNPIVKADPNFLVDGKPLETKYFQKQAVFTIPLKSLNGGNADDLAVNVRFQVCNDTVCLPPKTVKVSFVGFEDVKRSGQGSGFGGQENQTGDPKLATGSQTESSEAVREPRTETQNPNDLPLSSFIWLAITLGALSLLTPCVFPMIPITVSYFTNHAGSNRSKSVKLATVYSLGIIGTFTILGMLLAIFVGAAGINLFAANPYVNLFITAIFLFFAFNLFGAYEITIPTGILTKLDNLTRSKEGEGSGIVGALLMGLTFTLTSFTCTSPFVGTILVSASQGSWQMPLVGMLAFSTVFALPFFVLALLPQYVSSLPRAGGWMNSVKVAMGFLEVAAAMKFISNVDLIWKWGIFTRPVVLAIWIALFGILAVYLLGKFQLPHDSKPERIGAFRLMSAVVSLAISFYLLTGLFGAKLGELESFLPPDLENSSARIFGGKAADELKWIDNDLEKALAQAKTENKRVFIDFTGYTCTNCRWMEANIFPKKEVEAEMSKFILARLYTDDGSENNAQQQEYQEKTFQTVALPFYAILDANGKTVSTFPGLTRNTPEFVEFLQKSQKN